MAGSTPPSPTAEALAAVPAPARRTRNASPWAEVWRRFRRHNLAVAGTVILVLIVAAVLLGPYLWRIPINDIDFGARLAGPSLAHPLGTDDLGQDLLARMLYGGRVSLAGGPAPLAVAGVGGVLVGLISRLSRGSGGARFVWVTHPFLSLPQHPGLFLGVFFFFG